MISDHIIGYSQHHESQQSHVRMAIRHAILEGKVMRSRHAAESRSYQAPSTERNSASIAPRVESSTGGNRSGHRAMDL